MKTKNIKNIAILFNLMCVNFFYAQDDYSTYGEIKNIIPEGNMGASPEVAAFQKNSLYDVSLYTGKASVSIPIYEIKSGDISVPISIDYNSGGIKVEDYATSVGLNWNLNAGGNIVRIVKDFPDNEVSYGLYAESDWDLGTILNPSLTGWGYNRKGAQPSSDILIWGPSNRFAVYSESSTAYSAGSMGANYGISSEDKDISPDLFIVNAPDLSSKFTCVNNSNNEILPNNPLTFTTSFLDNPGYKMNSVLVDIRPSSGLGFYAPGTPPPLGNHYGRTGKKIKDFYEFSISNDKGIKYKFEEVEISESLLLPSNFNDPNFGQGSVAAENAALNVVMNNYSKKIHTWNLKEIEDTNKNKIIFEYETYSNGQNDAKAFVKVYKNVNPLPPNLTPTQACQLDYLSYQAGSPFYPGGRGTYWEKNPQKKRLKKIIFNEGEVTFNYNLDREDHLGEKSLDEIIIKNFKGEIIEQYIFNYSYFDSKENCLQPECKRLKLTSIDRKNNLSTIMLTHSFEYEYINKLPKRGSLEQDFLGYYNNNGLTGITPSIDAVYTPKLYFYSNNGVNSVLPFIRTDNPNYLYIPGQIDLTPNNYSLTGLLKTITYPTGSQLRFVYENNSFKYLNQTYTSGGARIKNQSLYDNNVLMKKMDYEYKESDGSASGYINNFPVYGYISQYKASPFLPYSFVVYDKPKNNIELTNGSYVGYSRVVEKETNNGYTVYNFTSPKETQNILEERSTYISSTFPGTEAPNNSSCMTSLVQNSGYPSIVVMDNDYMRGKLLKKFVYNDANINPIYKEEYNYLQRNLSETNLEKRFIVSYYDGLYSFYNYGLKVNSKIKVAQYLNTQIKKTTIFNNQEIETITDLEYSQMFPFVKKVSFNANNSILTTHKYFCNDPEVSSDPYMVNLFQQNRLSETVKEQFKRDNEVLKTTQKNYDNFNLDGVISPKEVSSSKGLNLLEVDEIIDIKDNGSNILQYHNKAGIYTSIIWGYKKSLPIAKIENATYSEVQAFESNLQSLSNTGTETNLIAALNNLRTALPHTMITTYTYKPLVGITSMTDSKGNKTIYNYDSFNRLQFVKDNEGKILSENQYRNRTQN